MPRATIFSKRERAFIFFVAISIGLGYGYLFWINTFCRSIVLLVPVDPADESSSYGSASQDMLAGQDYLDKLPNEQSGSNRELYTNDEIINDEDRLCEVLNNFFQENNEKEVERILFGANSNLFKNTHYLQNFVDQAAVVETAAMRKLFERKIESILANNKK